MVSGGRGSRRGGMRRQPYCTGENSREWIAPAIDVVETPLLGATQRMRISVTCLLHYLRGLRNVQAANIGHHVCMRGRVGRFETAILTTRKTLKASMAVPGN